MNRKLRLSLGAIAILVVIVSGIISGEISKEDLETQPTHSPTVQESTQSAVAGITGQSAQVKEVVDGDTIKVNIEDQEYTVRMIGINTPETKDPRRPVECFGKQASGKSKELLEGKTVILQKDVSETDRYDRLLRYVFLPLEDGQLLFVNDYLVREGYAKASTFPPDVKYQERFMEAENAAKMQQKGLWSEC